jgi:hypothetical protein
MGWRSICSQSETFHIERIERITELATTFGAWLARPGRIESDRSDVPDRLWSTATRLMTSGWQGDEHMTATACECSVVSGSHAVPVYNEEAFRHFLDIEEKRSERTNRLFFLVLVSARPDGAIQRRLSSDIADPLFSILQRSLRETDFTGWYRQGQVAGAVLTQHASSRESGVGGLVLDRIVRALSSALPGNCLSHLDVRVVAVPDAEARS